MQTLQIVLPVLIMLFIGMICNKTKMISDTGIENIKKFITTFPLPLTIFHAVSTAYYDKEVVIVFGIMLASVVVALSLGFVCKGIVKEPYRKYFPYIMTIYEGGMMAFPLYQSLMGIENMSNIAIIDVPCGIFAFGVYFGLVKMTDQGTKFNIKELIKNAFSSPCFVALLLGLFMGTTGLMNDFLALNAGDLYLSIKNMLTAPLSAMILLCVGYEFSLDKNIVGVCLKTVFARVIIQGALLLVILYMFATKPDMFSEAMKVGLVLYFITLPSLCLSSFVKNQKASKYISTTSSIYLIITLVGYSVLAWIIGG